MNANKLTLLVVTSCVAMVAQLAAAKTIPAGTMFVLKTTGTISSRDSAGRQFQGRLIQNAGALPAGTDVVGVVKSPRVAIGSSVRPLTLVLTQISVRGHMVPIKTQTFEMESGGGFTTRRGKSVSGGAFLLTPGTILHFLLSEPVKM